MAQKQVSIKISVDGKDAVVEVSRLKNAFDTVEESATKSGVGMRDAFGSATQTQLKAVTAQLGSVTQQLRDFQARIALKKIDIQVNSVALDKFQQRLKDVGSIKIKTDAETREFDELKSKIQKLQSSVADKKINLNVDLIEIAKASQKVKEFESELERLSDIKLSPDLSNVDDELKKLNHTFDEVKEKVDSLDFANAVEQFRNLGGGVSTIGSGLTENLTKPIVALETLGVKFNSFKEDAITTFAVFLKDGEKAKQLFQDLSDYADKTPFSSTDVISAGTTLLQAKIDDLKGVLRDAGDLAAANKSKGISLADTSNAFARVQAGDFGEAFERFRDFGVSRKQLEGEGLKFDKGGQYLGSVEQAMAALRKIVQDNFSGLTEKVSANFSGQLSTLSDTIDRFGGDLSEPVFDTLKSGLDSALPIVTNLKDAFAALSPETKKNVAIILTLVAAFGPALVYIGGAITGIAGLVEAFGILAPIASGFVGIFGTVGSAVLGIGGTISTLITLVGAAGGIVPLLGAAFTVFVVPALTAAASAILGFIAVAGGVIAVVAGIAAVAAGLYLAWETNFGGIRDLTISVWNAVKTYTLQALNYLNNIGGEGVTNLVQFWTANYPKILETVQTVSDGIKSALSAFFGFANAFWQRHGEQITSVASAAYKIVGDYISNFVANAKNVFALFGQVVNGDWNGAWETFVKIVYTQVKLVANLITDIFGFIEKTINVFAPILGDAAIYAFGFLIQAATYAVGQTIYFFAVTLPTEIINNLPRIGAAALQIGGAIIQGIKDGIFGDSSKATIGDAITQGLKSGLANGNPTLTDYFGKLYEGAKSYLPSFTNANNGANKSLEDTGSAAKTAANGLALTKDQTDKLRDLIKDLGFQVKFFGQETQVAATKQQLLKDEITNLNDPLVKQALALAAQIDALKNLEKARKAQIELYGIQSQASEAFYSKQIADVERSIQRQTVSTQAGYAELTALTTANFNKTLELTLAKNAATLQDDKLTSDERRNLTAQFSLEQVKATDDYRQKLLKIDDDYYQKTQENLQQNYEFSKNKLEAIKNTYSGLDSFFNPQNFNAKTAGNLKDGLFGKDFEAGKKKLDSQIKSAMELQGLYQDLAGSYREVILTNTGTLSSSENSKQFALNESLINDVKNQSAEVLRLQTQLEKAFPTQYFELDALAQNLSSANASIEDFDKASRKLLEIRQIFERSSLVAEKNFILAQKELAQKSGQSTFQFDQQLSIVGNRERQLQIEQTAASVDFYNNSLEGLRDTLKSLQRGDGKSTVGIDYEYEKNLIQEQIGLLKQAREIELDRANSGTRVQIAAQSELLAIQREQLKAQEDIARAEVRIANQRVFNSDQVRAKVLGHLAEQKTVSEATADGIISAYEKVAGFFDKKIDNSIGKIPIIGDIFGEIAKQQSRSILTGITKGLLDKFLPGLGDSIGKTNNPIARPIVDELQTTNKLLSKISGINPTLNILGAGGGNSSIGGGGLGGGGGIFGLLSKFLGIGGGITDNGGQSADAGGNSAAVIRDRIFGATTRPRIVGGTNAQSPTVPFGAGDIFSQIKTIFSSKEGGIFAPRGNILNGGKTSALGGTIGGIGQLATLAGGLIGGTTGKFVSNISSGALLGLQLGGPIGAGIGAAAGLVFSLFGLGKDKKLDKKENLPKLQTGFTDALSQMRQIVETVKAVNLGNAASFNELEVVKQTAEIRAQITSGFGIDFKSKKYKKEAQNQIAQKLREFDSLNIEFQAALTAARSMKEQAGAADERSRRLIPEFATGTYASADFIRRNGQLYGGIANKDSLPSLLMPGELVLNQRQQAMIRRNSGFDVFATAQIPNYSVSETTRIEPIKPVRMATGGFVGNAQSNGDNNSASGRIINFNPNFVFEGVNVDENSKVTITDDESGFNKVISFVNEGLRQNRVGKDKR